MGEKASKMSPDAVLSAELITEKLSEIGVTTKKMFGGFGIFYESKMFGLINPKGQIHFKVDADLKASRLAEGSEPHSKMPYVTVPSNVLEDLTLLIPYAKASMALIKK